MERMWWLNAQRGCRSRSDTVHLLSNLLNKSFFIISSFVGVIFFSSLRSGSEVRKEQEGGRHERRTRCWMRETNG